MFHGNKTFPGQSKLSEQKKTKFELIEVSKPVEKVLAMARKFL